MGLAGVGPRAGDSQEAVGFGSLPRKQDKVPDPIEWSGAGTWRCFSFVKYLPFVARWLKLNLLVGEWGVVCPCQTSGCSASLLKSLEQYPPWTEPGTGA